MFHKPSGGNPVHSRLRLRDEVRLLQAALKIVDVGVVAFSSDGIVTHANARAAELLGAAAAAGATPVTWLEHLRPRTPEGLPLAVADLPQMRALGGQPVRGFSFLARHADVEILLSARGDAVEDVTGRALGAVLAVEDVTEQRAREAMLRQMLRGSGPARETEADPTSGLAMFTQPIVDVESRAPVIDELMPAGVLSRVHSGNPGSLVPVSTGRYALPALDWWTLGHAARIAKRERPVLMSLSAHAVHRPSSPEAIRRALEISEMAPSLVNVQIAETAVLADVASATRFAAQIADIGCRIAVAGFGSAQSAPPYVRHFPGSYLRFDAPRYRDHDAGGSAAALTSIVRLANRFGHSTIAGAVDEGSTLAKLREAGVDLAQGRLFGGASPVRGEPAG